MDDAAALGIHLKDIVFDKAYTSPLRRAVQTAEIVCRGKNLRPILDESLKEINMGDWEGLLYDDIKRQYREDYEAFWQYPHQYNPKKGETFYMLQDRVGQFLRRVVDTDTGNILVVSHAAAIKALMTAVKRMPLERLWDPPFVHGTCLTVVDMDRDSARILCECDMPHIGC